MGQFRWRIIRWNSIDGETIRWNSFDGRTTRADSFDGGTTGGDSFDWGPSGGTVSVERPPEGTVSIGDHRAGQFRWRDQQDSGRRCLPNPAALVGWRLAVSWARRFAECIVLCSATSRCGRSSCHKKLAQRFVDSVPLVSARKTPCRMSGKYRRDYSDWVTSSLTAANRGHAPTALSQTARTMKPDYETQYKNN